MNQETSEIPANNHLSQGFSREQPGVISSGALSLDLALGIGGYPRGHIVEIFGPPSSGKTTLGLHLVAETHKLGESAAWLDADHAVYRMNARRCGVDLDALYYMRPNSIEEAFNAMEGWLKKKQVSAIVLDSIAALLPFARFDHDLGADPRGAQEDYQADQLIREGLRRLLSHLDACGAVLLITNQIEQLAGVDFGNPETTAFGTRSLRDFASVRLDLRRIQVIKVVSEIIGARVRLRSVKNRFAPAFQAVELDLLDHQGISREGDLLDLALSRGIFGRTGSVYRYGELTLGQGRESARAYLCEHPQVTDEIERSLRGA